MFDSLRISIGAFAIAAFVIALVGTRLTKVADRLADRTGLGEAVVGALFLGGSTSLPGIVTSVTAAAGGYPELAVSNALGGIAAQTAFLAIADIVYKKANLEHAAASAANLTQGTLLISLLSIPLLATAVPQPAIWSIHPASFVLIAAYGFGLQLVSAAQTKPMWGPKQTDQTRTDEPEEEIEGTRLTNLWLRFLFYAAMTAVAGFVISQSGVSIAEQTGLSESVVGGLFTAVSTSLPELVTSIAAVRQGALTLAVGDIIGGNSFDVLFIAFADFAYREGSIYGAITNSQSFTVALTILMTGILLLGLLRRERHGIGNIGFESVLILLLYIGGFALLFIGV
ncbi:MAG: sodium:calcium antiporter [Cyanophyceae cyanobacterium]